jgi:integrase
VDELIPPAAGISFLWDSTVTGFGVYVTAGGCKTYVLQYRMGGRGSPVRRYTIGRHGNPWTPEAARQRALDLKIKIRQRIDPLEEDRAIRAPKAVDTRLLLANYLETYLKRHAEARNLRKAKETRAVFEKDILPYFGSRLVTEITRSDVVALLDKLSERSPGAAVVAYAALRTMFYFARKRSDIRENPIEGLGMPHRYESRDRFLNDWEIQRFWEGAEDVGGLYGIAMQMLLLTGQRRNEVLGMRWEEINFDRRAWVIPKERSKNKREHLVPLTTRLLAFIRLRWADPQSRKGLLFTYSGENPLADLSKRKKRLDAAIARRISLLPEPDCRREMPHFRYHDLRRTVATGLQGLRVLESHTEALLNHQSGTRAGIVGVYQRHQYEDEKREALELWHDHLRQLMRRPDAWPGGRVLPPPE